MSLPKHNRIKVIRESKAPKHTSVIYYHLFKCPTEKKHLILT